MQTRLQSFIEASVNIVLGYVVALIAQLMIFPLFEIDITLGENILIALFFTVVSLIRMYLLRRFFNHQLSKWIYGNREPRE